MDQLQVALKVLKKQHFWVITLVVTILGLQMGGLLGGAVLTETVFGLAGVGRMLFEAITARDYPIIQAFTVVIAVSYMVINLIVDVSYGFLDPRIRLE